tara:strand:- start:2428 stop:3030 length:603 start_codon:yes stop_codon:yes gene_type:complete
MGQCKSTPLNETEMNEWYSFLELMKRQELYEDIPENAGSDYFKKKKENVQFLETIVKGMFIKGNCTFNDIYKTDLKNSVEKLKADPNFKRMMKSYKKADQLMEVAPTGQESWVKFVEDEDIYIDCKPVDVTGEVVDSSSNILNMNNKSMDVLQGLTDGVSGGALFDNIGFQTLLGIVLLGVLYSIGNYIFIKYPKNVTER